MVIKFVCCLAVLALQLGREVEAGFRCSLGTYAHPNWACSATCVVVGQTSGNCDPAGVCHCSERTIDLQSFLAVLDTRCELDSSGEVCRRTCHAIGRVDGSCVGAQVTENQICECSEQTVPAEEFALCASETTCRLDCQRRGFSSGKCCGWSCNCESKNAPSLPCEI